VLHNTELSTLHQFLVHCTTVGDLLMGNDNPDVEWLDHPPTMFPVYVEPRQPCCMDTGSAPNRYERTIRNCHYAMGAIGFDVITHMNRSVMDVGSDGHMQTPPTPRVYGDLRSLGTMDSALLVVAGKGDLAMVRWLVDHGANLSYTEMFGETALLKAASNGHLTLVQWLCAAGDRWSDIDNNGCTPLHVAAMVGCLPIVEWLLQTGYASVVDADYTGNTVLLHAAAGGHLSVVRWLLDHGNASPREMNDAGETILAFAATTGHTEMMRWLLGEGHCSVTDVDSAGNTVLLQAAAGGDPSALRWLLTSGGSSPEETNQAGETMLLRAASNGHVEIVQWLLQTGLSNIEETCHAGRNALSKAGTGTDLRTFEWLLLNYTMGWPHWLGWHAKRIMSTYLDTIPHYGCSVHQARTWLRDQRRTTHAVVAPVLYEKGVVGIILAYLYSPMDGLYIADRMDGCVGCRARDTDPVRNPVEATRRIGWCDTPLPDGLSTE
jgi:ankyrin repeat protein